LVPDFLVSLLYLLFFFSLFLFHCSFGFGISFPALKILSSGRYRFNHGLL